MSSENYHLIEAFEEAWQRADDSGSNLPSWEDFLSLAGSDDLLVYVVEMDIEQRARRGLPGIIQQRYWEHPVLAGRLGDEQKIGLIKSELLQRRKNKAVQPQAVSVQAVESVYAMAFPALTEHPHWQLLRWGEPQADSAALPQARATDVATMEPSPKRPSKGQSLGDNRGIDDRPDSRLPSSFGRYRVVSLLGKGGFGQVYRAVDEQLQRDVAIKVTLGTLLDPSLRESFLTEARIVAALDYPSIVPVHDVGQTESGDFFVVSKLIDGSDLASRMKLDRPDRILSLRIIEQIADALNYAHSKGLVHRDIKPANILLDRSDRPYLTDFGIALRESERRGERGIAGTPAYMSPEQARGEGHRIDNRSDIYSLGVILYELLTGRRPFRADNPLDLMMLIATEEVRSPRLFDDTISTELERICLKALARRASDRFTVARDFAEEIRWLLANQAPTPGRRPVTDLALGSVTPLTPQASNLADRASDLVDSQRTGPTRIVPKGLRSFDASDASFFLELLPGPFDREGLPDGLRFWKRKIEQTDPEQSFKVGLVYGPSGCGKSSLMKAGVLPRLSPKIITVYLEATPEDTETRLLRGVRKAIPDAEGLSLKELLSTVRRRHLVPSGGKLLLVIDQFEQWLFAEKDYAKSSLTDALRQCDGAIVQTIVMVREDFWISVSRFLRELEISIEQGNSAMVDLFDHEHASKVLGLFGKAYGKLPDSTKNWSSDQHEFIRQAVDGLALDHKVIPVRIAVLADMMKSRDWSTAALREVGGIAGVGVTFLEEMFGTRHSPLHHRQHLEAVRGLLLALLPSIGTDIKGSLQSAKSLQKAAGYEHKPREFQELMDILDKNLRLITPVDDDNSGEVNRLQSYQLAHDYMVPALRDWLTQKQRETQKGRAELKLAERAAVWSVNNENKQLPTLLEWLQIRRWTVPARWTVVEQALMRKAGRVHLRNWGTSLLAMLLLGGMIGYLFQQQYLRGEQEKITVALDSLQKTLGPSVLMNIENLVQLKQPDLIRDELQRRYASTSEPREKLSLAFALASFGQVESDFLISQLDFIEDQDTGNLLNALSYDSANVLDKLKQVASQCTTPELYRRKARLALTALGIGDTALPVDATEFLGRTDQGVRTCFIDQFPRWQLKPAALVNTLQNVNSPALRSAVCLGLGQIPVTQITNVDKTRIQEMANKWFVLPDSSTHSATAWLMRQWNIDQPKIDNDTQIVPERNWFVNSQGVTFVRITPPPSQYKPLPDPIEKILKELKNFENLSPAEQNEPMRRLSNAKNLVFTAQYERALIEFDSLIAMEETESTNFSRNDAFTWRLLILAKLKRTTDADDAYRKWQETEQVAIARDFVEVLVPLWLGRKQEATKSLEQKLATTESSNRDAVYSLALIAANFAADESTNLEEKKRWVDKALNLLERWKLEESDRYQLQNESQFQVLREEPRFVKLAATALTPKASYWIAKIEVTRREFEEFTQDERDQHPRPSPNEKPAENVQNNWYPEKPLVEVSWNDAIRYCNWLSKREGRTPAYRSKGKLTFKNGSNEEVQVDDWQFEESANGYRFPWELEWEFACRAGSTTYWSHGNDVHLLPLYCQMLAKQPESCGKKLPNAWGLHDMHGNVYELCMGQGVGECVAWGGWWASSPIRLRTGIRTGILAPGYGYNNIGLRLALNDAPAPGLIESEISRKID